MSHLRQARDLHAQHGSHQENEKSQQSEFAPLRMIENREDRQAATRVPESNRAGGSPLVSGVNQSVELLGRTFHAQTELCGEAIRTEIFLAGKIVATREARLGQAELRTGAGALRARLVSFHKKVLSGLDRRADSFNAHSTGRGKESRETQSRPVRSGEGGRASAARKAGSDNVEFGLLVRKLYEELRQRLEAEVDQPPAPWADRLERAREAFAKVRASAVFPHTRVDEQASVHVLEQQVDEWLSGERHPAQAVSLWTSIEAFSEYTKGINQRSSLVNLRMAAVDLEPLKAIDGFISASLVDSSSGKLLGAVGRDNVDLELAAAGNAEVMRAKRKMTTSLQLEDQIEDILFSLGKQYHILRPLESASALYLFVVLDRHKANLAIARHAVKAFEGSLDLG